MLAENWTQYRGPAANGISNETVDSPSWSQKPALLWETKTNLGFSSFVNDDQRLYTLITHEGKEACLALDIKTGKKVWLSTLGPAKYDRGAQAGTRENKGGDGPRSTPAIYKGHIYIFDAHLKITCLNAKSGKQIWSKDLIQQYNGKNIKWQNAASPLIDDNRIFVAGGGKGQALMALNPTNGNPIWKAHDDTITHATPVAATLHGVRQIIFFTQTGLVAVVPGNGKILWRHQFDFRVSTAASPVIHEDVVYCSAGYGVGAEAIQVNKQNKGFVAKSLWKMKKKRMNHWSTPVCKDGFLYGIFGFKQYGKAPLKCVDIRTGKEQWSKEGFGPGNCIYVDNHLVVLSDQGDLYFVKANPKKYDEIASHKVLKGKCWSTPAFSDGHIYVRSTVNGVCLKL